MTNPMKHRMQKKVHGFQFSIRSIIEYLQREYMIVSYFLLAAFSCIYFIHQYYKLLVNRILINDVINLHKATCKNDTIRAIRLATKNPFAINVVYGNEGYTPFLRACLLGNTQLVNNFILLGADLKSCTKRKENGFYLAVYNRIKNRQCCDASCIHALYHAGIDINLCNDNGYNTLQLAAMFGHTSLVQWLIKKNANNMVRPSPWNLARSEGHLETANILKLAQNRI